MPVLQIGCLGTIDEKEEDCVIGFKRIIVAGGYLSWHTDVCSPVVFVFQGVLVMGEPMELLLIFFSIDIRYQSTLVL